ncbi:MAG: hypothetical protein AB7V16_07330 [Vulcanibacillus sp.]
MLSQLDILATLGEDALQNHYQMIIPPHPGLGNILNLNSRILSVEIPPRTIGTYTITKRGKTLTRPSGILEQGNEFSFTYRPDKQYDTYKAIGRWMNLIQDSVTGLMPLSDSGPLGTGGVSLFRVPITVLALDANNVINSTWIFMGCWPTEQSSLSFSEDTGEPLDVTITMQYTTLLYPLI